MAPRRICGLLLVVAVSLVASVAATVRGEDPPAINPFGPGDSVREGAIPGYIELSDGSVHPGRIYLTRDKRLQVYDEKLQRQREVPLEAVKQIECAVKREWMEKEWKFKESTTDEKMFTGRSYPVREYQHTITLPSGQTITGPLSGIVYVQPPSQSSARPEPEQFILNKRNKGEAGTKLESLVFVKQVKLGKEALEEGVKAFEAQRVKKARSGSGSRK
jgi:hypothetical protein